MVREVKAPARADRDICTYDVRQRLKTHLDLESHALSLLHTDQADFIFLHLSIPHSPNIWSRLEDNYTQFCDSSYLDNLALADHILGRMLAELQASPRWQDTTVIVEGDHGWRTFLWDDEPAWTDEDDAASRGVYDPRPALLIHQPGQTQPATNSTPWPLLRVHTVVEQTLRHQPVTY
jgi:membrane-anchored protein YejM (alkaline phosphatase superfamily)